MPFSVTTNLPTSHCSRLTGDGSKQQVGGKQRPGAPIKL